MEGDWETITPTNTSGRRVRYDEVKPVRGTVPQSNGNGGGTDTPNPVTSAGAVDKVVTSNSVGGTRRPTAGSPASPISTRTSPASRPPPSTGGKPSPSPTAKRPSSSYPERPSSTPSLRGTPTARPSASALGKAGPPPVTGSSRRPRLGLIIPS